MPDLPYDWKHGIKEFLSPQAMDIAWNQYQKLMLEKLDRHAKDEFPDYEWKDIKNIVLSSSREPSQAAIFNHASMAHNNHFFFKNLTNKPVEMPELLKVNLERSFGSIETLRREMVYTAEAMFGPGFVWLVKTDRPSMANSFKVLTTYLAGSPYPGAHWRRQDMDMNTIGGPSEESRDAARSYLDNSAAGARGASSPVKYAPGGVDVIPLLCLNTWEHVWLPDWGTGVGDFMGLPAYAGAWWDRINWNAVAESAQLEARQLMT